MYLCVQGGDLRQEKHGEFSSTEKEGLRFGGERERLDAEKEIFIKIGMVEKREQAREDGENQKV